MTITLIVNTGKERAVTTAEAAISVLKAQGVDCLLTEDTRPFFGRQYPDTMFLPRLQALEKCDIVVTVGGDGTILHTVSDLLRFPRPVLGINVGHLGFLAALEPDETDRLALLAKHQYTIESRRLLKAEVLRTKEAFLAFNEFAFSCAGIVKQITCTLQCDGVEVAKYSGDGMLVASTTGSTAYSLSAGGPIVDADIAAMIATPICAHSLNAPSMVFSGQRTLNISVFDNRSENSYLVADGQEKCRLENQDNICVTLSEQAISLVSLDNVRQFRAVDLKLKKR